MRDSSVSSFEVVVAEHDITLDDGQERFRVCSIAEHPNYNRWNHYKYNSDTKSSLLSNTNDYALSILTLCNPITFKREASPVCLPSQPGSSYDGVVSTVSGWGTLSSGGYQPDELMEVNVTTIDNTECNTAYGGDITDNMICAKGDKKDACQGDSGGKTKDMSMKTISMTIYRTFDNQGAWWLLLSDRHSVLGYWVC